MENGKPEEAVLVEKKGRVPEGAETDGMKPVDATPEENGKPEDGAEPVGYGINCVTPGLVGVETRAEVGAVKIKPVPVEKEPKERSSLAVAKPDGTLEPDGMYVLRPFELVNGTYA